MCHLDSRVLVETKSGLCVRRRKSDVKKATPDLKQKYPKSQIFDIKNAERKMHFRGK